MRFISKLIVVGPSGLPPHDQLRQPADVTVNGSVTLLERTLAAHPDRAFILIRNIVIGEPRVLDKGMRLQPNDEQD